MKSDVAALVGACLEKLEAVVRVVVASEIPGIFRGKKGDNFSLRLVGEAEQTQNYHVAIVRHLTDSAYSLLLMKMDAEQNENRRTLVFTSYASIQYAEKLRSYGIEFVDSVGNMHINLPWLRVFIGGYKLPVRCGVVASLDNPASLKIIYTLLASHDSIHWTQRDMAEAAGVALGSVAAVYKELRAQENLHLREEHGTVVREIVKASALLERWLIGYGERLRRNLLLRTYRLVGNQSATEIVPALENAFGEQVLVGGELGATILEPGHLHPGAATLHLDPAVDVKKLALRLRMVPDKDGNVTLLQTFGTANALDRGQHKDVALAHPLLLYAELLQGTDPRTREFAREFYDARIKGMLP